MQWSVQSEDLYDYSEMEKEMKISLNVLLMTNTSWKNGSGTNNCSFY